ncbi:MAG: BON domain-containing protein [Devosia sp.]|uniref:BON domain-containing protein n=1 Tax=Devosia sp. TaxID=1871048 RepID=UPI001AC52ED8|nr:BON domain-containing protein [Devosia sp.]MBN9316729.1 BON domain-containing protein [Devosia sp.]
MREDHKLQAAVQSRLDFDPAINSSRIGVGAREGIVTISGHVPSLLERSSAERAAGQVKGVKAVINELLVDLAGENRTSDEQIAERAYARLASNVSVPLDRLHFAVKDGTITLHGDVDWHFQLQAAIDDLRALEGVREIRSDAQIRPPIQAEKVHEKIKRALADIAPLDAERIRVTAEGSKVTLAGEVTSWHEKGLAESTAWCVPGVTQVDNRITVL